MPDVLKPRKAVVGKGALALGRMLKKAITQIETNKSKTRIFRTRGRYLTGMLVNPLSGISG